MTRKLLLLFLLCASAVHAQVHVRCGASIPYTDTNLVTWSLDSGLFNSGNSFTAAQPIKGTPDQPLFLTERYAVGQPMIYTFTLSAGNYHVNLLFSENYVGTKGARIFDVKIQGATALKSFDIFATAGASFTALIMGPGNAAFDVPVTSTGKLAIEFDSIVQNAKIDAIEILPIAAAPPPPLVLTFAGSGAGKGIVATFFLANGTQVPTCNQAVDGDCSLDIQVTLPDGTVVTGKVGGLSLVKTVTLPIPQTQTIPILLVMSQ